ncbi:MAG: hypothetical protein ACOYUZ_03210 [Patescibacteria group bacterium]
MAIKLSRGSSRGTFPQPPAPKLFRNIAVTFVLITVAVIAIALWTSSVKARVYVKVDKEPVAMDAMIEIAPSPMQNQIQGRVVNGSFAEAKEFTVEVKEVADVVAREPSITTGKVKIINNYSKDQPLVVKTRLHTADKKQFRIQDSVVVPAGGSVEVTAVSDEAGFQYEIPVKTKLTIPGLWDGLQDKIYAESLTAFSGGGIPKGPVRIVTADAVTGAYDELYGIALEKAKQTLILEAGADPAWESVFLVTEAKKQSNAAVGEEADSFLAQVKLDVTAVFFPKDDVVALVQTRLQEKMPQGYTLGDVDMAQITFRLEGADETRGVATLAVSAEANSQLTESSPALKKDGIVGLPLDEVIRKWSAIDGVQEVDVILEPSWVHRLPSMKDKISVIVK